MKKKGSGHEPDIEAEPRERRGRGLLDSSGGGERNGAASEDIDREGVVGFLLAPTVAAIGAFAALAADYSIEIERETPEATDAGVILPA
ncbi:hypothetical protein ACQPZ2_19120 [Nocardia pseudovaccinii]|uniref:hypothetical protein n=1 Tax=Nocardia pseudovaccinii TaxID=189540 RepID=UPI003D8D007C